MENVSIEAANDKAPESPVATGEDGKVIVWFDIDNTLYSASSKIADAMGERIHAYFLSLGLSEEEASDLHHKYYTQYGLALRGLVRHHNVDTLDFDRRCDGSIPLETMLKPDPSIRKLIQDVDRSKARVWALTNAYVTHATRVLRILNLEDLFEGLVYCDYAEPNFYCKPEATYFNSALKKAGVTDASRCYFIDDSRTNVQAAVKLGWGHCVHFCESGLVTTEGGIRRQITGYTQDGTQNGSASPADMKGNATPSTNMDYSSVKTLEELRHVWPEIFQ